MPYEEKMFTQYFMPYRELGVVKEASKDLVFNINEVGRGQVEFKVFATSRQQVRIVLRRDEGKVFFNEELTLSPEEVQHGRLARRKGGGCRVVICKLS